MEKTFRESMNWLHTWAGLMTGGILFAVFWTGTLCVYDREIDRWMMPTTRIPVTSTLFSADSAWQTTKDQAIGSPLWVLQYPNAREPTARALFADAGKSTRNVDLAASKKAIPLFRDQLDVTHIDPANGAVLPDPGTRAGTGFLFPFHWHLHLRDSGIGQWIVGFVGMAMLMLIISGVIIHRDIFTQFFTLRARKATGRTVLDLHNVSGVLALPFHFVITISGLAIFLFLYFPSSVDVTHKGGMAEFFNESRAQYSRPAARQPGEVVSLDAMVAKSQELWGGGMPVTLVIYNPGDANAVVEVGRSIDDTIPYNNRLAYFDAGTGALLQYGDIHPIATVQRFIAGLHFINFRHWTLRFLYFVLGIAGCALIATGLLYWVQARKKLHGARGVAFVEGMTTGSVGGLMLATLAFFIVNRLLPLGLDYRSGWEIWTFSLIWIAAFAHAWARPAHAWREQMWGIAAGSLAAVALNWITTGDHLARTLATQQWGVAGMDVTLLVSAWLAFVSATKLRQRKPAKERVSPLNERAPGAAE